MRFKAGCAPGMQILEGDEVTVRLSADEALVLFELLSRWSEQGLPAAQLEHPSEQTALWAVEGQLEKQLVVTFDPRYREALDEARSKLAGG